MMQRLLSVFLVILVPLVLLVVYLFFKSEFVLINKVYCKSQYGSCSEEDFFILDGYLGSNIFTLSVDEVEERLGGDFKNRRSFVHKVFPRGLSVTIEKRKPWVAVFAKDLPAGSFFVVDKDGIIIDIVEDSSLPKLEIDESTGLEIGGLLTEEELSAAGINYEVQRVVGVRFAKKHDGFLEVGLSEGGVTVYLPVEADSQVLVGALQVILAQARMDNKMPKEIDLRYRNPVLRY